MTRVLLVKHLKGLRPVDEAGEALIQRLGQGEIVSCEIKQPRNIRHHRLFFALLSLVWEQVDHERWPTVEDLLTECKIITGHYDRRDIEYEGKRYPILTPKSISFAAMDQTQFEAFFSRVCDWVAKEILPGVSQEDLRQELESMAGMRSAG